MNEFVFLLDALVLIFLIIAYLELTGKRNAYVGADKSMVGYLNYFIVDGVADDVQVQEAVDYISRIGGGITNLAGRTYSIDNTIEMKSNVWMVGENQSSNQTTKRDK